MVTIQGIQKGHTVKIPLFNGITFTQQYKFRYITEDTVYHKSAI